MFEKRVRYIRIFYVELLSNGIGSFDFGVVLVIPRLVVEADIFSKKGYLTLSY